MRLKNDWLLRNSKKRFETALDAYVNSLPITQEVKDLSAEREKLKTRLDELWRDNSALTTELESLKRLRRTEGQAHGDKLQQNFQRNAEIGKQLRDEKAKSEAQKAEVEAELLETRNQARAEIENVTGVARTRIQALEQDLQYLRERYTEILRAKANDQQDREGAGQEGCVPSGETIEQREIARQEYEAQLFTTRHEAGIRIQILEQELELHRKEAERFKKGLEAQVGDEVTGAAATIAALEAIIDTQDASLKEQHAVDFKAVADATITHDRLQATRGHVQSLKDHVNVTRDAIDAARVWGEQLQRENQILKDQITGLQAAIEAERTSAEQLQRENRALKDDVAAAKVAIAAANQTSTEQLQLVNTENQNLRDYIAGIQSLAEAGQAWVDWWANIGESCESLEILMTLQNNLGEDLQRANAKIVELENPPQSQEDLQGQLQEARTEIKRLKTQARNQREPYGQTQEARDGYGRGRTDYQTRANTRGRGWDRGRGEDRGTGWNRGRGRGEERGKGWDRGRGRGRGTNDQHQVVHEDRPEPPGNRLRQDRAPAPAVPSVRSVREEYDEIL